MAFSKKPGETGWFYHAPAKPKPNTEPVGVPPPSQIPGLDGQKLDPDYQDDFKRIQIKETDSPYIRLAKQGGRPNLLQMKEPKAKSNEPKGYPRVDWYYDQDTDPEQQEPHGEQYRFLLPDYMVHTDSGEASCDYKPKPPPFNNDGMSVYKREDSLPNDKTVKLPELSQPGHGVRSMKAKSKGTQNFAPIQRTKICKPPSPSIGPVNKYKSMSAKGEDDVVMGKLLSMGYLDDWRSERDKWQKSQGDSPPCQEKTVTEYQEAHHGQKAKNTSNNARTPPKQKVKLTATEERKLAEDRELFKLSKYKNVPARINNHRVTTHAVQDQAPMVLPVAD